MRLRLLTFGVLVLYSAALVPVASAQDTGSQQISRVELLQVLLDAREETRGKVEKTKSRLSKQPLFIDVARDEWYAPYAEVAFTTRVTSGFPDRTLRPHDPVPVEEAITLLMRSYHQSGLRVESDTEWFAPFVRGALAKRLIASPRTMSIGQPITRAQFQDMVSRMETVTRDGLAVFPDPVRAPQQAGSAVATGASQDIPVGGPVIVAAPTADQSEIEQYASGQNFAITIPSLGIRDMQVSHPEDSVSKNGLLEPLKSGVGHLFSYPGRGGKIMIYGHSSGYAWDVSKFTKIFTQVNKLKKGDKVYVTYNGHLYAYSVTGQQKIRPDDRAPFAGQGEELILYTCWPVGSNKSRLIIRAEPVETVAMR